jgi:quinone-modifying oxidoreductase, subunit QmoC
MTSTTLIKPSRSAREEIIRRGGESVARCFQCATCSSVCDLSTPASVFPRRQMLWAQWGLVDKLAADPSIWLCHEGADCSTRCPRDARPSDVLKSARSLAIEELGAPKFLARMVGNASTTWPVLLGVPVVFWAAYVYLVNGFAVGPGALAYNHVVPNWMIDSVFVPAFLFAIVTALGGARRAWAAWGAGASRQGTFLQGLSMVAADVLAHRRFSQCEVANTRKWSHTFLVWGFLAAFVTTASVATSEYAFGMEIPLAQTNPIKLLGNLAAVLLTLGVLGLIFKRMGLEALTGHFKAFDGFFLWLVALVTFTGIASEIARYVLPVQVALSIYVVHLGMVLALFVTFPFSKFAHALYRTMAMAHERLTQPRRPQ